MRWIMSVIVITHHGYLFMYVFSRNLLNEAASGAANCQLIGSQELNTPNWGCQWLVLSGTACLWTQSMTQPQNQSRSKTHCSSFWCELELWWQHRQPQWLCLFTVNNLAAVCPGWAEALAQERWHSCTAAPGTQSQAQGAAQALPCSSPDY